MPHPFRILSLSGGGIRGIYQAGVLKNIATHLKSPLSVNFDLICGTSTGAIIALAIALNIDINLVYDLFKKKGPAIFKKKNFWFLRYGSMYDQKILKKELEAIFGTQQLKDCIPKVIITASYTNKVKHRVFTNLDSESPDLNLSIVDIILCSTAAPLYFQSVMPQGQEGIYLDGGLWANSPSTLALLTAHKKLNLPYDRIHMLAIGTCEFPVNVDKQRFARVRKSSLISHVKTIFDMFFLTQESYDNESALSLLGPSRFLKINSSLDQYMTLSDYKNAIEKLPGLAEQIAIEKLQDIKTLLHPANNDIEYYSTRTRNELISDFLIEETGLSGFFPSREYYGYRHHAGTLEKYVETANDSLIFVSISLIKGINFDNLREVLKKKIMQPDKQFMVTISLLNPNKEFLIESLAVVLEKSKDSLISEIRDTAQKLLSFRNSLQKKFRKQLKFRYHNAIPFASAIIFDKGKPYSKIQLETKPYKSIQNQSFAFEIIPVKKDGFYFTLLKAYEDLIADGESM